MVTTATGHVHQGCCILDSCSRANMLGRLSWAPGHRIQCSQGCDLLLVLVLLLQDEPSCCCWPVDLFCQSL
jgi:hypothetical protein